MDIGGNHSKTYLRYRKELAKDDFFLFKFNFTFLISKLCSKLKSAYLF